jgi:hypothetical protein
MVRNFAKILRYVGSGSLPLGRLFEGHVNAIVLVLRYGRHEQIVPLAREVRGGMLLGVWNTDDRDPLRLSPVSGRYRLQAEKYWRQAPVH